MGFLGHQWRFMAQRQHWLEESIYCCLFLSFLAFFVGSKKNIDCSLPHPCKGALTDDSLPLPHNSGKDNTDL